MLFNCFVLKYNVIVIVNKAVKIIFIDVENYSIWYDVSVDSNITSSSIQQIICVCVCFEI